MTSFQLVRIVWDRRELPLPDMPALRRHTLHVGPEPGYPFGRKGAALWAAWRQLAAPADAGMLVTDGDVAFDPADVDAMQAAIEYAPADVHTAPVKLWPSSTMRPAWIWGHWDGEPSQDLALCDPARHFTFNLTYLPRRLLEACARMKPAGLQQWAFPQCDSNVSAAARKLEIPVHVVYEAQPKHIPVSGFM